MPNKGIIMLNGKQYGDTGTNYNVVKCTQQEYDAMTPEQKNNGCLYIVLDSTTNSVNYLGATVAGNTNQASGVSYDDSQTHLGASNVQDAIGQINADLTATFQTLANGVTLCKSGNIRTLHINGTNLADGVQLIPLNDCPHYDIWCSGLINVNNNFDVGILYIDISGHLSIRDKTYNVINGTGWFTVTWIV